MNEPSINPKQLDLAAARARLAAMKGRQYWRSLDELAQTEEFEDFLHREFPEHASELFDPISRRSFLKFVGASLALAGLSACTRQPEEKIVPYAAKPPEEFIPGIPQYFATAMTHDGFATGLLVQSYMGRPTKIEGNPEHPASRGATDIFAQASILDLYDPDRSQVVMHEGQINTWENFVSALRNELGARQVDHGAGLRILTGCIASPTLAEQLAQLLKRFPAAKWHSYDAVGHSNSRAGARLAFGEDVQTQYHFDKADVILSLDADFLGDIRYARDFVERRRVRGDRLAMNRLYVVESTPTLTGAMADHRFPVKPSQVVEFIRNLPAAIRRDLESHRSTGLVLAGESQPAVVHALAHSMNHELGNAGITVTYTGPVGMEGRTLSELVADMNEDRVQCLVILGGNPAFTAPADLQFTDSLQKVKFRVHLGLYDDETAAWCHWHVPAAHYLESWGDTRARDGTVTIQQPLIAPLYGGRSAYELLALILNQSNRSNHDIVRQYWTEHGLADDNLWHAALHDGVVPGTAAPGQTVTLQKFDAPPGAKTEGLELVFRPDPTIWDGAFANNGWLQELPKPFSKLTWDNAALISPATATKLGLANEDVVGLQYRGRSVHAPVWIQPGQPDDCVTVHFGYGRTRVGRVGRGAGFNAYAIRTSDAPWFGAGLMIARSVRRLELATTQHHQLMDGRNQIRVGTIDDYRGDPDFVRHMIEELPADSLYPAYQYDGYAWGMAIDTNACTGCSACVVACQSENNIPVVGKEQVLRGREMHWIRIDRYYEGDLENPGTYHQPVPCMHCENAPCEVVCPVGATVHDKEGLNEMVYNRCVGTRYCSNNCPYKVRRFNFLQFTDDKTPSLKLQRNPNVTVRMRGVMEKCSYCIQRINAVRINAEKENRPIRDGEITPACAQACPTQAIVFGNINDPNSRVSQWKSEKLNYGLLVNLNTRPRTTYLARLRNPNPELNNHGG
ncbi:MAG TPA: TAT-variant-translocated molybdopterin oxidoreductase [Verrucomicrobiae bacterium]|nr:TAT-variant-translocated molybdopterin oxidoreductase [Verrucomicrobiae bacterium]